MKDPARHLNKLNKRVVRSAKGEELPDPPRRKQTEAQRKKQAKAALTKERNSRTPIHMTEEERNRKMKHRAPIFDRYKAEHKSAKPTSKKTPRI